MRPMPTSRARAAAVEILTRWEAQRERSPLDRIVAAEFRARHELNSRERRWIAEAIYGTVRLYRRQTVILERLQIPRTPAALLALWTTEEAGGLRLDGEFIPEERAPDWPERFASVLRALPGREAQQDCLRTTLSFPDALATELEELLGEEALAAGEAFNRQAPVTLRVNPLRVSREKLLAAVPDAAPTRFSPWGIELPRRVNIHDLPGYRAGWFEVQEEASQLAAFASGAQADQTVVEVGAGAGGKALALAALMGDRGRLIAIDSAPDRLEALRARARRAGVRCCIPRAVSADPEGRWIGAEARLKELLRGGADLALLDAPCTGSGVLRRSPDARWRRQDPVVVAALQRVLLEQTADLLKPGGTLLYVTCAFERFQNEEAIAAFLESEAGAAFRLEPALPRLAAAVARLSPASRAHPLFTSLASGPFVRTWPHRHGLDAFFLACLRRERAHTTAAGGYNR